MGNGVASELGNFGQQLLYLKLNYGFYLSDLGVIGDYVNFGLIYLLGISMIIYSVIVIRKKIRKKYLLYSFYYFIISMITLSNFGVNSGIVAICILLFMLEKDLFNRTNSINNLKPHYISSNRTLINNNS